MDFGSGPLTSAGGYDIFVAKYSSSGTTLWSKRIGSATNGDYGFGIAVDGNGDVLVTGFFSGTVDFGGGPLTSFGYDMFVVKYSGSNGTYLWAKNFTSAGDDIGYGIATDSSGNVFVTGAFVSGINFGGGMLLSAGSYDIFLVKLAGSNGAHLWSKRFGGASVDSASSVVVDAGNDVAITGSFTGSIDFGGGPLTGVTGAAAGFLAKVSGSDGSHVWSKGFACSTSSVGYGVAADRYNNDIITIGSFKGTVNFGGGPLTSSSMAVYIAKYSSAGSYLWSRKFGDPVNNAMGEGVAMDGGGNAIVTGGFQGTVDFGGGPQTSANGAPYIYDIFLSKFAQ